MFTDAFTAPRKLALAGITAAFATTMSTPPAAAWGVKEQQFLAGVVTTLVVGSLVISSNQQARHQPSYASNYPTSYAGTHGSYQGNYGTDRDGYYPSNTRYNPPHHHDIYHTPAAKAFNSYGYNERLRIQATLANYGYYHGSIDGAFGPQTFKAVKAYAHRSGNVKLLKSRNGAYALFNGLLT